jgi:DNA polymerase-3 subunit gamma/tau
MPLIIDYRPKNFNQVAGNKSTIMTLKATLKRENRPHVYLLTGPRGCGKTTLARIISRTLKCRGRDFNEINCALEHGKADSQFINRAAAYLPWDGPTKVYILDEAHAITKPGQEAMLKILEEPPDMVYFILCTTKPSRIDKAVRSRCSQFVVSTLTNAEITTIIDQVLDGEGREPLPENVMEDILHKAQGVPREALSELEKVIGLTDEDMDQLRSLTEAEEKFVNQLSNALLNKKTWPTVKGILDELDTSNAESIRWAVIGYMRKVILNSKPNPRAAQVFSSFAWSFENTGEAGLYFACLEVCNKK